MRFPDAEALVLAFLKPVVSPVAVHVKVPKTRPATFVRAWRSGGASINRVLDRPMITVQAWATDSVGASELAMACRDAFLHDYTRMPLVRGVEEVTGLYFDPDPDTGIDRYTFTIQLMVRGKR